MAERRMFAKSVVDSDAFLDMSTSARLLYYDLGMRADDDGFITPKRIMRMTGASEDDLRLLIAKGFIVPFESGVIVLRHWWLNNYIQNDRYTPTIYQDEISQLTYEKGKGNHKATPYSFKNDNLETPCIQDGYKMETQDRIGKDRIGKDRLIEESNSLRSLSSSCSEPSSKTAEPEPVFITIPTNKTGEEFEVTQAFVDAMNELYPNVDVEAQIRSMKAWAISNPSKRKTKQGMTRFINSWLAREQDKGRSSGGVKVTAINKDYTGQYDNVEWEEA